MVKGLLLINLGSPDASTTPAVRRYLRQFLMDRHVIDSQWPVRALLVHGFIAPLRAPKSAHAYQSIWREEGSPLVHFSQKFVEEVQKHAHCKVELAMRYGRPNIRSAVLKLQAAGVEDLRVIPLYPQFAKSSTLTAIEKTNHEIRRLSWRVNVRYLQDFYDQPEWIRALAKNIQAERDEFKPDHLLMSYHGLPEHHIQELDRSHAHCLKMRNCCDRVLEINRLCYRAQCFATSRALNKSLGWTDIKHSVAFQSRLGRRPWIRPFSDQKIIDLAKTGVKRLLVTCPSFVADCLETLEEVAIRLRKDFIAAGGEDLRLVPAVNESPEWAADFCEMVKRNNLNWLNEAKALTLLKQESRLTVEISQ